MGGNPELKSCSLISGGVSKRIETPSFCSNKDERVRLFFLLFGSHFINPLATDGTPIDEPHPKIMPFIEINPYPSVDEKG